MNTPAHLLIGAAAFGSRNDRRTVWAAMAGAMMPDLSLYILAGGAIYGLGYAPEIVFRDFYYSEAWQTVFAIDNSFFVWGAFLIGALIARNRIWLAFAGAGFVHLLFDFPLHHDDGRPHFWPFSDWVFESPFSYWDRAHGAGWIGPVEGALAALAAVRLFSMRPSWPIAVFIVLALLAELSVTWVWVFVFSG